MKNHLILFIAVLFFLGCEDKPKINSIPIDLSSCFSPEFGMIESEQFFFNLQKGELTINLDGNITTQNLGYSIQEGSKTVFIYRHFLENSFNIIDDEVEVRLLFEVDSGLNSIEISSVQDFEKSKCIYSECGIALQSISGSINGIRSSENNWFVNANLKIDRFNQEKVLVFSEAFNF